MTICFTLVSNDCPIEVAGVSVDGPPLPGSCIPTFSKFSGSIGSVFTDPGVGGFQPGDVTTSGAAFLGVNGLNQSFGTEVKCADACPITQNGFVQFGYDLYRCSNPNGDAFNLSFALYVYNTADCSDDPQIVDCPFFASDPFGPEAFHNGEACVWPVNSGQRVKIVISLFTSGGYVVKIYNPFIKFSLGDPGTISTNDFLGPC